MRIVNGNNALAEGIHLEREMIEVTNGMDRFQRFMPGRLRVDFRTRDPWFLKNMYDSKPVLVDLCAEKAVCLIRSVIYDGDAYAVKLEETRDPKHTHELPHFDGDTVAKVAAGIKIGGLPPTAADVIGRTIHFDGIKLSDALAQVANAVGGKVMAPKNKKIPTYYVAAASITRTIQGAGSALPGGSDYIKYTEKEAVDQARKLVESDGEDRYIVKIIRRVRRKPQPVVVENV